MRLRKIIYLLVLLLATTILPDWLMAAPIKVELNKDWQFRQWRLDNWYPAKVPGVVHLDLMDNKLIEDPFFRLNERSVQWIDKEDWMYETHFDVSSELFGKENIRLHFMGLDTYARVYLNGEQILEADNMFREWLVDVKELLKEKENKLEVFFLSPIKVDIPKWDALPYQYPTGPDQSQHGGIFNKTVSIFARKAGYHYGWDWGPRLVTSGIWRPVYVEAWDDAKIENIFFYQKKVSPELAKITHQTELLSSVDGQQVTVEVVERESGKVYAKESFRVKKGENNLEVNIEMENPKLWWSNGLGEPNLYNFETRLYLGNKLIDSKETRVGIRSIEVVNEPDEYGTSFYFKLNGVPLFAKGANYIPSDNFLPRVTREVLESAVKDAADANMNMLRVWGGGSYEEDEFYELCDEHGIMVWQDFMFACSMYPSEGQFLESVKHEAIDNIKRLRNHPSIVLWCGNNEAYDGWFGWGRKEEYAKQNPEYARVMWRQYADLFHDLLPNMVAEYAPHSFYWPSSPYGLPGKGCDSENGDKHYWGVWHGREPIGQYNIERSRFFSEYGFQSFPEFESVKQYAPYPEDWGVTTEVMMHHQRAGSYANNLINEYLLNEYREPKDFESFLYMNQVLQGDAIKIAMEAHRRDMPYCMGTLFWQHNDCWPVASWSSRDYYGRWKAQHYFAREAYKDILVSPISEDSDLNLYIISDRLESTEAVLELNIYSFKGKLISTSKIDVVVEPNNSKSYYSEELEGLLDGNKVGDVFLNARLLTADGKEYENNYFFNQPKYLNLPKAKIEQRISKIEGGYRVTLSSKQFARAVFLSIEGIDNFFSNNYFDIVPNREYTVDVETSANQSDFRKQLKVVSLVDGYN